MGGYGLQVRSRTSSWLWIIIEFIVSPRDTVVLSYLPLDIYSIERDNTQYSSW
jgi:hypothetical protein